MPFLRNRKSGFGRVRSSAEGRDVISVIWKKSLRIADRQTIRVSEGCQYCFEFWMQSTTIVVCILLKLILQERRPFVCMLSFLFVRTLSGRMVDLYVDTFEEVDAQYHQKGIYALIHENRYSIPTPPIAPPMKKAITP